MLKNVKENSFRSCFAEGVLIGGLLLCGVGYIVGAIALVSLIF